MRGITEERLRNLLDSSGLNNFEYAFIRYLLAKECKELNLWQPIETAPKDREILVFAKKYKFIGRWNKIENYWEDDAGFELTPTHWQELPEDPK